MYLNQNYLLTNVCEHKNKNQCSLNLDLICEYSSFIGCKAVETCVCTVSIDKNVAMQMINILARFVGEKNDK